MGKHNYAILVKQMSFAIRSGIELKDAAIKMGASGATTVFLQDNKFLIPKTDFDALKDEDQLSRQLIKDLHPHEEDVSIIGTDNSSKKRAEFAGKNAAPITIISREHH